MKWLRVFLAATVSVLVLLSPAALASQSKDDNFGMYYDGGYVPSGTQGIKVSYSISTTGVSCSSQAGSVAAVDSVRTNGGSPEEWWLQMMIGFYCYNYPSSAYWQVGTQVFNTTGGMVHTCPPTCGNLVTLSISTYPALSGTIDIHYTGSVWAFNLYVSQTGHTYSTSSYSSIQGTKVDGSAGSNDWTEVETDNLQSGISFSSSFAWTMNNPLFYNGGVWQNWNVISNNQYFLKVYAGWNPTTLANKLAVKQITSFGVQVYYYGSNPPNNNGQVFSWYVGPCCVAQ